MNAQLPLGSIEEERARRLRSRADQGSEAEGLLRDALSRYAGEQVSERATAAYDFAKSLDYDHPGLSAASYLAHPVRLAVLMLSIPQPATVEGVELALLHNVFEQSSVQPQLVSSKFGEPIATAIRVLTVDRKQTAPEYTAGYYQQIRRSPLWVQQVKVLDKFDNLFVLCLNPSASVRTSYLADIEKFVVPMAAACLPNLDSYLRKLVDDCYSTGYLPEK